MTYLVFLLIFVCVPIAALAILPRPDLGVPKWRAAWSIPLLALIAFLYTTPWDNFLVYREVWYYGLDRVLGTAGYVPYEEYGFFVLQSVLTGLWTYHVFSRAKEYAPGALPKRSVDRVLGLYLFGFFLGIVFLYLGESALYMGLILSWACPVLAALWYFGQPLYRAAPRAFAIAFAVPTVYLWGADIFAMSEGIWTISDATSFDIDPLGLPVEEAMFFLVTNLLVVQGVLLFAYGYRLPSPFESTSQRA